MSTKFGSTAFVNTRIFITTLTLWYWSIHALHCSVLGQFLDDDMCVSQLRPFLGFFLILSFFLLLLLSLSLSLPPFFFYSLHEKSTLFKFKSGRLHWEFNSGAIHLKKLPFLHSCIDLQWLCFILYRIYWTHFIFKSVPTRVCQDTVGTNLAMLNLSNLDAILCTTAHATIRKHGTYKACPSESGTDQFMQRFI